MRTLAQCLPIAAAWLLLWSAPFLHGQFVVDPYRFAAGGPWTQTLDTTGTSGQIVGSADSTDWAGFTFTAAYSGTVDTFTLQIRENGTDNSGTETIDVMIYTDSSGSPGTQVTNALVSGVSLNDLPDVYGDHTFDFGTDPSITASTAYWVVVKHNAWSATEHVTVRGLGNTGSGTAKTSGDGATWSTSISNFDVRGQIDGNY